MANTEKNSKEECKVIFTRSQMRENTEREKRDEGVLEDVSNEEGEKMRARREVTRSCLLRPKFS